MSKNYGKNNIAKGLCRSCTRKHVEGKTACQYHLDLAVKRTKDRQQSFKLLHLCITCGKDCVGGSNYCKTHLDKANKRSKSYKYDLMANGKCTYCYNPKDRDGWYCSKCLELNKISSVSKGQRLKDAAYAAYGGYKCICCNEDKPWCLTIDHINNDGAEHRKTIKRGGYQIYKWLRDNNYPPGFQILCANCQLGKLRNSGKCPHNEK